MRIKSKLLLLSFLLTINCLYAQTPPTTMWSNNASTSWFSTQNNPYIISSAEELAGLAVLVAGGNNFQSATFKIANDIDLGDHLWSPIGIDDNNPFSGNIDGQGFEIKNLFIVEPGEENMGLLGKCYTSSLRDIIIRGVYMRVGGKAGALVGEISIDGEIENCHAIDVDIIGTQSQIGGLVGVLNDNSDIRKSSSQGAVTGESKVGGLLGEPFVSTTITECFTTGTVSAQDNAGGLIGFSTYSMSSSATNIINNCYSRANVSTSVGRAGGLCGGTEGHLVIRNSYSTGSATGNQYDGGFIGSVIIINTLNNFWDTESSFHTNAIGGWVSSGPQTFYISGKTTAFMKSMAMIDSLHRYQPMQIWSLDPFKNDGYPILLSTPIILESIEEKPVQIDVYPTVFDNKIIIESEGELDRYEIYDISGKIIQNGRLNDSYSELNTQKLSGGVYILKINSKNSEITKKVFKN